MHQRCPIDEMLGLGHIDIITAEHGFMGLTKTQHTDQQAHLSRDFQTLHL